MREPTTPEEVKVLHRLLSSLPGLTRQSMRGAGSLSFAASCDSLHVGVDHRVKPGGDDGKNSTAFASLRASAKQSSWPAREAGLLRRCRSSQ